MNIVTEVIKRVTSPEYGERRSDNQRDIVNWKDKVLVECSHAFGNCEYAG
jgi:hypothetical protein